MGSFVNLSLPDDGGAASAWIGDSPTRLRMSVKEKIEVGVEESGVDVERVVVDEEMRRLRLLCEL